MRKKKFLAWVTTLALVIGCVAGSFVTSAAETIGVIDPTDPEFDGGGPDPSYCTTLDYLRLYSEDGEEAFETSTFFETDFSEVDGGYPYINEVDVTDELQGFGIAAVQNEFGHEPTVELFGDLDGDGVEEFIKSIELNDDGIYNPDNYVTFGKKLHPGLNRFKLKVMPNEDDYAVGIVYVLDFNVEETGAPVMGTIDTNLVDGTTYTTPNVPMEVVAKDVNGKKLVAARVQVKLNGEIIGCDSDSTEKTNFTLNLREGANTVDIITLDKKANVTKTYTVYYEAQGGSGEDPQDDENLMPTITTSLDNASTFKNSPVSMEVFVKDGKGEKLPATAVEVKLNGTVVQMDWDDIEKTTYKLALEEGINTVVITATNKDKTATKTLELTYEPQEDGNAGSVYLDIEMFTIGGDFLVEPMKVDIQEGENGAHLLDRVLKQKGFDYNYTGDLDNGFYLSAITGEKVNDAPMSYTSIPDYLQKALTDGGLSLSDREDKDYLGEFDFTSGAGWMYCVNNSFPNVGFADYYPQDGDVIRIQFTLAIGADIGGANFYGTGMWETDNKDSIIREIAEGNVSEERLEALMEILRELRSTGK